MSGLSLLRALAPAVLSLSLCLGAPAAPVPRAAVGLQPPEVVLGESAVLTISVSWKGEASELLFSRPEPPFCRGLSVTGSRQRSVAYRDGEDLRQVREFIFTLRAEEAGEGRVGPVRLTYRRPPAEEEDTLTTEPLEVPVVSCRSGTGLPLPAVIGLVLAAAVLAALYVRWMVRRYQKKSNEIISDYVENLESRARKELETARRHRLEGELEEYCRGMREVLQNYLERKTALTAAAAGGPAESNPPEPGGGEIAELARILNRLDEYWFSGSGDDMHRLDEICRKISVLLKSLNEDDAESEG